jgi:uncharacterized SAM-binding protein YcdF (DUF218 family)
VEQRLGFATDLGIGRPHLIAVTGARTTRDEARLIAERLRPLGAKSILLVTSGQHMPRASRFFEREGLVVFPVPANVVAPFSGRPGDRLSLIRDVTEQLIARIYNVLLDRL